MKVENISMWVMALGVVAFIAFMIKGKNAWSAFFALVALVGCAVTFTQIGIYMGETFTESKFYSGARRTIGQGIAHTASQAKEGKNELVSAKMIYLDDAWYNLRFFDEDGGESAANLTNILLSSEPLNIQPVDTDNPDNPPLNSKNQLDD